MIQINKSCLELQLFGEKGSGSEGKKLLGMSSLSFFPISSLLVPDLIRTNYHILNIDKQFFKKRIRERSPHLK